MKLGSTMRLGWQIDKGDYLLTDNDDFKAIFQDDGNFVIYPKGKYEVKDAIWSTGTQGKWLMNKNREMVEDQDKESTDFIKFEDDGNLVIYGTKTNGSRFVVWDSNTSILPGNLPCAIYFNCLGQLLFRRKNDADEYDYFNISRNNINMNLSLKSSWINADWKRMHKDIGSGLIMDGKMTIGSDAKMSLEKMSGGARSLKSPVVPDYMNDVINEKYDRFEIRGKFHPSVEMHNKQYHDNSWTETRMKLKLDFQTNGHHKEEQDSDPFSLRLYYTEDGKEQYDEIDKWSFDSIFNIKLSEDQIPGNMKNVIIPERVKRAIAEYNGGAFKVKYIYPDLRSDGRYIYDDLQVEFNHDGIKAEDVENVESILRSISIFWVQYFIENGNPFIMNYSILATDTFNANDDTPWKGTPDNLLPVNIVAATINKEASFNGINIGFMTRHQAQYGNDLSITRLLPENIGDSNGSMMFGFDIMVSQYLTKPIFDHLSGLIKPSFSCEMESYNPVLYNDPLKSYFEIVSHDKTRGIGIPSIYKSHFTVTSEQDKINHKTTLIYDGWLHYDDYSTVIKLEWTYSADIIFSKEEGEIIKILPGDKVDITVKKRGGGFEDFEERIKEIKKKIKESIGNGVAFQTKEILLVDEGHISYSAPRISAPDFSLYANIDLSL